MLPLPLLLIITAAVLGLSVAIVLHRSGDPFHPYVLIAGFMLVLYVITPTRLLVQNTLNKFLYPPDAEFAQIVILFNVIALSVGAIAATPAIRFDQIEYRGASMAEWRPAGYVLGMAGVIAWFISLFNVGGLAQAYGNPYAGGWSEYGYVREAMFLTVPALAILILSSASSMSPLLHNAALALFAMPLLVQGLLGARRGPLATVTVVVVVSYYFARGTRPKVWMLAAGGALFGLFLLFLVANRQTIFIGSDFTLSATPSEYLDAGEGNEYLYGAASTIHFERFQQFYWGRRYLVTLFIRPIPRQLWPGDKYERFGMQDMEENFGTLPRSYLWSVGWVGAVGAATGLIADMWIEFWWFGMAALFLIGFGVTKLWKKALFEGGRYMAAYACMASLLLYLVWQTVEAALFRLLIMLAGVIVAGLVFRSPGAAELETSFDG